MPDFAHSLYRGLFEAAPDAIVGVDADGHIVVVNSQTEHLFGYRRDELLGRPVEILVPDASRSIHGTSRAGYLADPRPRPMGAGRDLAGRRKDGSEFPAEISLSPFDGEHGLLVSAAIRDVTERIEAQAEQERLKAQAERERVEAQLHQSQRLESLGQLAGGVAHDFNNLLGAIVNYAAFVGEAIGAAARGDLSADWNSVARDVEQIQRAVDRASRLTHQLLAFARHEVVQLEVLDVNDVVHDVEQLLRRTLGEHVELTTTLAAGVRPVLADKGQIEQILLNLAVNARDAMPGGGRLTIDTSNITVDADYGASKPGARLGEHVRVRVSDTGTGMDADVARRAFEPFFTTKPRGEGTGLGLATVYGIVSQAGGHAQIYSEPGLGTTITVLLPATAEAATVQSRTVAHEAVGRGETVLVVEDEDSIREVTERILRRNGFEVMAAEGGPDALAQLDGFAGRLDVLITDVVMPQMLGKEVAERVRARFPDVRVLYMSGYAQPIFGSGGTLEPGVTLLEKPFSESTLLAKLSEVLPR